MKHIILFATVKVRYRIAGLFTTMNLALIGLKLVFDLYINWPLHIFWIRELHSLISFVFRSMSEPNDTVFFQFTSIDMVHERSHTEMIEKAELGDEVLSLDGLLATA